MQQADTKIIGIDLGTTNSVVAVMIGTEAEVIPNSEGINKTPSVVAFLDKGEVVVGEIARRQAATNPLRTISSVKRLMGRSYEEAEDEADLFAYKIVDHNGDLYVDIDGMGYRPEQISALILKKLKECAEAYLGEAVSKAVITVPAYFDDLQRHATMEAAEMAGLDVQRLINEPTAAAMAYGLGRGGDAEEIVAVYDFGGGTFDLTVLEITGKTFEVLTSMGDTQLGGDDLDNAIVEVIIEEFLRDYDVDLTQDPVTVRRMKEVAERAKCELSATTRTTLSLPFIAYRDGEPLHLERNLDREEFEELIEEHVRRTIRCCKRALEDANLTKRDIKRIILVGGTTRIPMIQDAVEEFFDQEAFRGVNPDEVVALGAAAQAGIFEGNVQEVVLLDVTPHSLGIEVEGGRTSRIIEKNSTIPIKAAKTFTTTEDRQEFVNIHVLQGEDSDAAQNRSLGKFSLTGIPAAPAGVPRIRVTFFINADGVMEISAEDLNTGQANAMTVVHSNLTEDERRKRSNKRKAGTGSRRRSAKARRERASRGNRREESGPGGAVTNAPSSEAPDAGRKAKAGKSTAPQGQKLTGTPAGAPPNGAQAERGSSPAVAKNTFAMVSDSKASGSTTPLPPGGLNAAERRPPAPLSSHYLDQDPTELLPRPDSLDGDDYNQKSTQYDPVGPDTPPISPRHYEDSGVHAIPPGHAAQAGPRREAAATAASEKPPVIRVPRDELPDQVMEALSLAASSAEDGAALDAYAAALERLRTISTPERAESYAVVSAQALLSCALGQAEETRAALRLLRERHIRAHGEDVLRIHTRALSRFLNPNFLRDLAYARERMGDLAGACEAMEQAYRKDPVESDKVDLERMYRARLDIEDDPSTQFKLVKILLKSNRVDEAIEVLQDLQQHESYRARALKILGLCHWQKNMHYLAWQHFKSLSIDEDMADILYRLASDMEANDQLQTAMQVLEHLSKVRPEYRDLEARLRKLAYRLKIQREEQASARDLPILSKDSRFVILEEINRGSMGIIFKARDKTLNEIVALKVLNDYLCSDPSAVERFKSEARAAKRLSHQNVVRIHDLFEMDGKRFLSMEYIEGTDLKRILTDRTHVDEEQILSYFLQICDALAYAHNSGIIHRDIKPANIMITNRNQVKITDFGIAKILRSDDATKSGTAVIGTPLYMAPEQIIGDPVDARTDIYSLGIMLYEVLAGNPPFYLGNIEYHHIHTAPPELPAKVGERLQKIIMKMIAKDPKDRFQSVEAVVKAVKTGEGVD